MKKKGSKKWFVKVRGSYLPHSWQGWLTYIPYIAYLLLALVAATENDRSTLAEVFNAIVYWVIGVRLMTWVASNKS